MKANLSWTALLLACQCAMFGSSSIPSLNAETAQQQRRASVIQGRHNYTNGAGALRRELLNGYNRFSYPFEHHWEAVGRTGLPVHMTINFHRVFAVEVTKSSADLIVWVRITWNDPRLVWDPSDYHNITTVQFWVGDGMGMGETSEIWTPDLHLWNAAEPLTTSLADAHALVSSDGTVFWARPGHMRPACKFEGLERFPFDTLSCTMEIGSWANSGLFIRPQLLEEGHTMGGSITAGEAFAEFTLTSVDAETYVYPPFRAAPTEDWPVLLYHVHFSRAWQPYARGFLVLQILLNLIGFCSFWLPPKAGERMGLSITALLSSVASELVVTEKLPAFGELSWVAWFSMFSLLFTAAALFENCAVIFLHYHMGGSLTPRFITSIRRKVEEFIKESKRRNTATESRSSSDRDENSSHRETHRPANNSSEEVSGRETHAANRTDRNKRKKENTADNQDTGMVTQFDLPTMLRRQRSDDTDSSRDSIHDNIVGLNADDFKNVREMENNARWQQQGVLMDEWARVLFPAAYFLFLAITFSKAGM